MRISQALGENFDAHASALPGPFVGLFGQHGADEADDGGSVREMPTTWVRRRISLVRIETEAHPLFRRVKR